MTNTANRFSKISPLLLLIAATQALAQLPDLLPQRGVYPNGAYTFDASEAINKYSGVLTYSIPITKMPLGRAGMTVPVNFVYSSALVDYFPVSGTYEALPATYGEASASASGGWSFQGFNYGLYELNAPISNCTAYLSNGKTVPVSPPPFQFGIIMPDGAHHVLRLYGQTDTYGNASYWYSPVTGTNPCTGQSLSSLTYYTTDGSYIRVSVNPTNPTAYPAGGPFTIYLPDGTQVSGAGWGSWANGQPFAAISGNLTIADRNGNKVTVTRNSSNSTTTLQDDLGRTITVSGTSVTQTGFGGSSLTWSLSNYTTLSIGASCENPGTQGCGSYLAGGPMTLQVPSDSGTLQYHFTYNTASGQLASVTLPSGATTAYTYAGNGQTTNVGRTSFYGLSGVGTKQVSWVDHSDGGSTTRTETWTYNYGCPTGPPCSTSITAPDGGTHVTNFYGANPLSSMVTAEILPDQSRTETMWQQNPPYLEGAMSTGGTDSANPFMAIIAHVVAVSGQPTQAAVEQRSIDQNGNVTQDTWYDWMPYSQILHDSYGRFTGFSGTPTVLRTSSMLNIPYVPNATNAAGPPDNSGAYWNPSGSVIGSLLRRSVTAGASGTPQAATENAYTADGKGDLKEKRSWDNTLLATLPTNFLSPTAANIAADILSRSNASVTTIAYDASGNGNVTNVQDPNGNSSAFSYSTAASFTNLYPTQEIEAVGSAAARTFNYTWDYNLGVVTKKVDVDNGITTAYSYDTMGRQTQLIEASGALNKQTNTTYDDANLRVIVYRDLYTPDDEGIVNVTTYDQLYRPTLSQSLQGSNQSPTDPTAGYKVQTRYGYFKNGSGTYNSYKLVSNPYCGSNISNLGNCSGTTASTVTNNEQTMGWTLTTADQNGRVIATESFAGGTLPFPWNASAAASNPNTCTTATSTQTATTTTTGISCTSYSGNTTTVTDEAGNHRTNSVDGLGRLQTVTEYPSSSSSYNTAYSYDALDDLTGVTQSSLTRQFAYSSLKRLLAANNPENSGTNLPAHLSYPGGSQSWSTTYTYDQSGNVTNKQDNRNAAVSYTYDTLNRITSKAYTTPTGVGATPPVTYCYGMKIAASGCPAAPAYGIGQLLSVTSTNSQTLNTSYDALGRVGSQSQITGGNTYTFSYGYLLSGSLSSETYPSGRVFSTSYNQLNQPTAVSGLSNGTTTNYAGAVYFPNGAINILGYANTVSRVTNLNSRLQQISNSDSLGYNPNQYLWLENLTWLDANQHDNGNLQSVQIYAGGPAAQGSLASYAQTFNYDGVNRLTSAAETNSAWSQTYGYDAYGNMWMPPTTNGLPAPPVGLAAPTANVYNGKNQNGNANYDAAGNLTTFASQNLTFDAENRLTAAGAYSYLYDGDGRRVQKLGSANGPTTYVYDAFGRLSAEYAGSAWTKDYVRMGGQVIATENAATTPCKTCYFSVDHLGSTRMVTDQNRECDQPARLCAVRRGDSFRGWRTNESVGCER